MFKLSIYKKARKAKAYAPEIFEKTVQSLLPIKAEA